MPVCNTHSLKSDTSDPIYAKYSYGREDLLALNKIDVNIKPPSGIEQCLFYTDELQKPILLQPQTENELVIFFLNYKYLI